MLKKLVALTLVFVIAVTMTGCSLLKQDEFDESGYVKSVLQCSFLAEYDEYMSFTGANVEEAQEYRDTTLYNAAVRFFSKYGLNANETQMTKMKALLSKAYSYAKFSVNRKEITSTGCNVKVDYTPITIFTNLEKDIQAKCDDAKLLGIEKDEGSEYIDSIIDLCANMVEEEPSYSTEFESIVFELREDSQGYISMNVTLLSDLDEAILPF